MFLWYNAVFDQEYGGTRGKCNSTWLAYLTAGAVDNTANHGHYVIASTGQPKFPTIPFVDFWLSMQAYWRLDEVKQQQSLLQSLPSSEESDALADKEERAYEMALSTLRVSANSWQTASVPSDFSLVAHASL